MIQTMKNLIITIDTEGDNLWHWKPGDKITTENTLYLQRFQDLCNQYGFKPTWLSNYEMMEDSRYVDFVANVEETHTGELGMHLHAWNNPPFYHLPIVQKGAPYLIEYPEDIMENKIATLTDLIISRTGIKPVSHRSGRWAMNEIYFRLLDKYGFRADCSVTPHINWISSPGQTKGAVGSDYSNADERPYVVKDTSILEVPLTIVYTHRVFCVPQSNVRQYVSALYHAAKGQMLWLRPTGDNLIQMKYVVQRVCESENDYGMFMLHSSELMPGGSPTFRNAAAIDALYMDLEDLFCTLSKQFVGITLREYINSKEVESI